MDIFLNGCLSLPEQVQVNKCKINKLFENTPMNYKEITIKKEDIIQNNGILSYIINDVDFKEKMFFIVQPLQTCDILLATSFDGRIVIAFNDKPNIDIHVIIWYNYNVKAV